MVNFTTVGGRNMKIRWYQPVILIIALGFLGMSVFWGFTSQNKKSIQVTPILDTSTSSITYTSPDENVKNDVSLFSEAVSFEDARKMHPDAHPVVAMFKSIMDPHRDKLISNPDTKRMLEIIESSEYAEFITTKPTIRETDEFWAKHGFIQDPDRFIKAFRAEFPTGNPEDFEPEMRAKFAELFRDADMENNAITEISSRFPAFFDNPRNHAWIQGYFDRDGNFGDWGENILLNLNDNLPQEGNIKESALIENPSANGIDRLPNVNSAENSDARPVEKTRSDNGDDSRGLDNRRDISTSIRRERASSDSIETIIEEYDPGRFSRDPLDGDMDTLNRYGSQEDIDKRQESDPDLADEAEHPAPQNEGR